jgi:hypothetical protein
MTASGEVFVGIDTTRANNAVAVAKFGRDREVRYLGEFNNTPDAVAKLLRKLAEPHATLHICYEAGLTGHFGAGPHLVSCARFDLYGARWRASKSFYPMTRMRPS